MRFHAFAGTRVANLCTKSVMHMRCDAQLFFVAPPLSVVAELALLESCLKCQLKLRDTRVQSCLHVFRVVV